MDRARTVAQVNFSSKLRDGMQEVKGLQGLIVVDVVEGTALASLPHMQAILASRPRSFPAPAAAVQWALRSGKDGSISHSCCACSRS